MTQLTQFNRTAQASAWRNSFVFQHNLSKKKIFFLNRDISFEKCLSEESNKSHSVRLSFFELRTMPLTKTSIDLSSVEITERQKIKVTITLEQKFRSRQRKGNS